MPKSEEDIKTEIANAFFPKSRFTIEKNQVDFAVRQGNQYLYWAESKKGRVSKWTMLAQLLLTIKPKIDNAEPPPQFLGCFDEKEISFVSFYNCQEVLATNDFNWKEKPSAVSQKSADKTRDILSGKEYTFDWHDDQKEIRDFIAQNLSVQVDLFSNANIVFALQINKNNFIQVFNRWLREVLPSIQIPAELYKQGIIDGDFYLADLLSLKNKTISQKLKVLLRDDIYEVQIKYDLFNKIHFKDGGKAHRSFWSNYERPPKNEYHDYIISRRDLLVPSGIRERKGAFFTPQQWVAKSQEYLAEVFGEDWQEEYYIWDCCAGTGNLENGLTNPERIWVSTLDEPDVRVMKESGRLFQSHIFKFDFLNDDFKNLPKSLRDIIDDPKKQEKLIIYINPPYAEATTASTVTGTGQNKAGVAKTGNNKYEQFIGKASNEIFAQFMARIHAEIQLGKLAQFSTLKYVNSSNFVKFRQWFKGEYKKGFVVRADTFDNVKGQFPIGFLIWDMSKKQNIKSVKCDVIDNDGKKIGVKNFYADSNAKTINKWIPQFNNKTKNNISRHCERRAGLNLAPTLQYPLRRHCGHDPQSHNSKIMSETAEIAGQARNDGGQKNNIGFMNCGTPDFQNTNYVYIQIKEQSHNSLHLPIDVDNLIPASIYFSVRHCISASWLNDRDQFLYPNDSWQKDIEFQNDCLVFTLFHTQNRIKSADDINYWIPFSPSAVSARDDFESNFMSQFLKSREFSAQSQAALDAGKTLWKYYHKTITNSQQGNINASLYEIREYFRGRNDSGRLASKSNNTEFQELDDILKQTLHPLAAKIADKVYKYGFLKQ